MKVLFITQKKDAPSTKWRLLQFVPHLEKAGVSVAVEEMPAGIVARLSQAGRDRLTGLEARGGSWGSPDISACPASALLAAKRDDACRGHVAELSRMSRAGLVEKSPRGACWAELWGGCGGLRLEDPSEEVSSPGPCGTGFLPAESRRFLWLFTKSDP